MKHLPFLIACLISFNSYSQSAKNNFTKFGKITVEDLQKKVYEIDSAANAVVLSDIGETEVVGNTKGWFSLSSQRHTVVHILNKNGYNEANIEIPLYVDGRDEEKVTSLKAVTYNLENGKIKETKLEKSEQFKERVDKNKILIKFTMPQVREGSIIEYEYEVSSDFISIVDPWYFQSLTAPTLWSEFTFTVPQFFSYNFLSNGYLPLTASDRKDYKQTFLVSENATASSSDRVNFTTGVSDFKWTVKNAPALKTENFTSSIRNHISRMEFQLAAQNEPLKPHSFRSTWQEITKGLLESENFGQKLNANNNWMSDEIKPLYAGLNDNEEKAKTIFAYVRDNFKNTGRNSVFMDQTLREVFKTKKGNNAEINLLLTAMLRYAGLQADPIILSTTGHGYSIEYSPMINSMNYVVVQFINGNHIEYLDASEPRLGFNKLPEMCYNGHARVVNQEASPVYFVADSIKENKTTSFNIFNSEGEKWIAKVIQYPGFYESYQIRNDVNEKGKEEFFKEIQAQYSTTAKIKNTFIDSLKNYEKPVAIKYDLEFNNEGEEILYVNPTFGEGYKKNPFAAAERSYPVEMPYASTETIVARIEVPQGYKVDELPTQTLVKLDQEGKTFFEYRISQSGNVINFLNKLKIARAFFLPEEYPLLREFFNLVVKKQNEQIVFKKEK